jgi:hypothetical protein
VLSLQVLLATVEGGEVSELFVTLDGLIVVRVQAYSLVDQGQDLLCNAGNLHPGFCIRILGDGVAQAQIDDDREEQDVEGSHHQLLQHQHLVECVVDHNVLNVPFNQISLLGVNNRVAESVQVGVMQLIWDTADYIETVNLDVLGSLGQMIFSVREVIKHVVHRPHLQCILVT